MSEKDIDLCESPLVKIERLREENSQQRSEIERLRGLIWDVVDNARYENEEEIAVLTKDFDKLEKEVSDE